MSKRVAIRFAFAFFWMFVVLALYWGWRWLHVPDHLPIRHVKVSAIYQHVDPNVIQELIAPFSHDNLFLTDVSGLQQQLLAIPWVKKAVVRRVWPDTLHIQVEEHKAVAQWAIGDGLVSSEGILFYPTVSTEPLPTFEGVAENVGDILAVYNQLQSTLTPLNAHIIAVKMSPRGGWHIQIEQGPLIMLGRRNINERWQRFLSAFPKLPKSSTIKKIDLRYIHGMAIQR